MGDDLWLQRQDAIFGWYHAYRRVPYIRRIGKDVFKLILEYLDVIDLRDTKLKYQSGRIIKIYGFVWTEGLLSTPCHICMRPCGTSVLCDIHRAQISCACSLNCGGVDSYCRRHIYNTFSCKCNVTEYVIEKKCAKKIKHVLLPH